jgi:hypothetical protein
MSNSMRLSTATTALRQSLGGLKLCEYLLEFRRANGTALQNAPGSTFVNQEGI